MSVLIMEYNPELGTLWRRHLERFGFEVCLARTFDAAVQLLQQASVTLMVLDPEDADADTVAMANTVNVIRPDVRIIFVTNKTFFSDGSIFQYCANACAMVPAHTSPEDLAAMVEHFSQSNERSDLRDHAPVPSLAQG